MSRSLALLLRRVGRVIVAGRVTDADAGAALSVSLGTAKLHGVVVVRNVTDEVYAAARRPAGIRPGLPRTILVGLRAEL